MDLEEIREFDELKKNDETSFIGFCYMVYNDPWFARIISRLKYDVMKDTFESSNTPEELNKGRMTAQGIEKVSELFHKYSNKFKAKLPKGG